MKWENGRRESFRSFCPMLWRSRKNCMSARILISGTSCLLSYCLPCAHTWVWNKYCGEWHTPFLSVRLVVYGRGRWPPYVEQNCVTFLSVISLSNIMLELTISRCIDTSIYLTRWFTQDAGVRYRNRWRPHLRFSRHLTENGKRNSGEHRERKGILFTEYCFALRRFTERMGGYRWPFILLRYLRAPES